jgi:hypothetical protein
MDYYKSKQMAGNEIKEIFDDYIKKKKKILIIAEVVLSITGRFGVGENFVRRQLELLCKVNSDKCIYGEDEIEFDN